MLKNRYEGLFIPGLGTRRYADCGRAMMDFLPRLIPGTLSTRMDATLAAMQSESNNGYNYLWRVLELYVPGFDPVVPVHPPQWADSNDVFHFAQAYLLYFRLQGKMLYYYTDCTRSGIILRDPALQLRRHSDTSTVPGELVPQRIRYGVSPPTSSGPRSRREHSPKCTVVHEGHCKSTPPPTRC